MGAGEVLREFEWTEMKYPQIAQRMGPIGPMRPMRPIGPILNL